MAINHENKFVRREDSGFVPTAQRNSLLNLTDQRYRAGGSRVVSPQSRSYGGPRAARA
jgi:hypothetical protein